jgi:hypothetical protein
LYQIKVLTDLKIVKMKRKKTLIKVPRGGVRKIARALNCSEGLVSLALNGSTDKGLTDKIRHVALTQYDGEEMKPVEKSQKDKK